MVFPFVYYFRVANYVLANNDFSTIYSENVSYIFHIVSSFIRRRKINTAVVQTQQPKRMNNCDVR